MAQKKPDRSKRIFNPFLLSLAGGAGWAATNSPPDFNNPDVICAWLITSLAVGLLVRAALALLSPILRLIGDALQHVARPNQTNDRNDI